MENKIQYSSKSYNVIKATIIALIIFLIPAALIIAIGRYLHNVNFVYGFIFICIIPFLFKKKFKNLFTRTVNLEFDEKAFIIKEFNDFILIKETIINWEVIKTYKCSFSSSLTTDIILNLRDGSQKRFSFSDQKNQEQAVSEKSVFSIFHYFVKQYNRSKEVKDQILLQPGFLTTKVGSFVLILLFCAALFGIVAHFFINPKTFKFSFMSLFIILGLIAKRKSDKNFYNRIIQLDPRSPFE